MNVLQVSMDFPIEEYKLRVRRLQSILNSRGIDAIILSEDNNFRYFAGFNRPFSGRTGDIKTRPFLCLVPKEGEPKLLVHASFEKATSFSTWIDNIHIWSKLPFQVKYIKYLLKEAKLYKKSITLGFELGGEQRLGFPTAIYLQLMKDLPEVKFVDVSGIIQELRIIKSEREIEYIKKACKIMSEGYKNLFKIIVEGYSEEEIKYHLRKLLMTKESEGPNFVLPHIFPGGIVAGEPRNRTLNKGDLLWIDAGAIYKGYRSDFSRIAVVGKPSTIQINSYKSVRSITMSVISGIEPGRTIHNLIKLCNEEMKKVGLPSKSAGRIGHGIGLDTAEIPSVMIDDQTILEAGMVITIEPGFLAKHGYYVLEEIIAVTEDGYDILTETSPEEPFII